MRGNVEKQSAQKIAAGIFTAAMVLLCAALYFFTSNAASSDSAVAEAAPSPSAKPELAEAADFVKEKDFYTLSEETNGARIYHLSTDTAEGTLTLSVTEWGVGEFVLSVSRPSEPKTPGAKASELESILYKKRLAEYQIQKTWVCEEAASLLSALSAGRSFLPADREAFLFALDSTITDGKSGELAFGDIAVQMFCYERGDEPLVITARVTGLPQPTPTG